MKQLTDVYLQNNKFKEIVELDKLSNLKYIQLGNNENAPIFKCKLSGLRKLEKLTFVTSNLAEFPEEVTEIPNLRLLWLFQNNIKSIPSSIKKLKKL